LSLLRSTSVTQKVRTKKRTIGELIGEEKRRKKTSRGKGGGPPPIVKKFLFFYRLHLFVTLLIRGFPKMKVIGIKRR